MKDNKEGQTHFQLPIDITDSEIEALQKVLEYSLSQETKDCEMVVFENSDGEYDIDMTGGKVDKQFEHLSKGHIYWELLKLQGFLDRINKKV